MKGLKPGGAKKCDQSDVCTGLELRASDRLEDSVFFTHALNGSRLFEIQKTTACLRSDI